MAATLALPKPRLELVAFGPISALTDNALAEAIGVRVAFTGREGGVSEGAYSSLNLGSHVQDDPYAVEANRRLLAEALGAADLPLIVPDQVHGSNVIVVSCADDGSLARAYDACAAGADGVLVSTPGVSALLCFADCTPVIVVSPTGRFAVVHAGWRGAIAGIAGKAVSMLADLDAADPHAPGGAPSGYNVYIGPYIHSECFETGADVAERFASAFGPCCAPDPRHVDLGAAVRADVERAGVCAERIAEAGICTSCRSADFFSYRASGGVCGRHGAFAFKRS